MRTGFDIIDKCKASAFLMQISYRQGIPQD
uniref:Uncharacterized protein n=1 Tax=Arundo donax TaxID=35708 RepID=A0A0A9GY02_ARUDO